MSAGMGRGRLLSALVAAVSSAALLDGGAAAARETPIVVIPAQPMAAALRELARQTGVNILFLPDTVRGRRSNPVAARMDAEDAARSIVAGAGLRVFRDAAGGLIVQAQENRPPSAEPAPSARPAAVAGTRPPPPVEAKPPTIEPPPLLEEIVVTATRQTDTVNRVPLSITAETQRGLDQRGLRTVQDLQATVPAMRVTEASGGGTAIIAIRGIIQTGPTAATTGFYLDDTPLQRRSTGSAGGVNGTPLPILFDLERIEVLRGPQGTLFGGGSEGGTIRYIQPQPSLTRHSAYARVRGSIIHHGDPSGEAGLAVGGPIVEGKLGFRASVFERHTGGFIDLIDPFTGKAWKADANSADQRSMRLALSWAPLPNARATLSYVSSRSRNDHATDRMTLPIPDVIKVPTLCYDTRAITTLPITSSARTTPVPIGRGDAECAAARASGAVTFQTPAYTLGPYNLGPYQSVENGLSAAKASFQVYSLDLNYDFHAFSAKSVTSYIEDSPKQSAPQPFQVNRVALSASNDPNDPRNATAGPIVVPSGLQFIPFLGPEGFKGPAHFTSRNPRYSFTQEVRFTSAGDARPISWVAGLFYANIRLKPDITLLSDSNDYSLAQFGITDVQRYGIRSLASAPGIYNVFARAQQSLKDTELAAFGEVNYWPTDRLKLIAGIRLSQVSFHYSHAEIGLSNGVAVATVENGGAFSGSVREAPVTPRFGVQYLFDGNNSVYVSAAKGYRAGGINTPVAQAQAGDSLARNFGAGFTVFNLPRAYSSDSVWSFEAGAKIRLFDRLQLNGAIYRIDWSDPQTSTLIPQSGATVTTNAVGARSQGVELEAQAALWRGVSLVGALGYDHAAFTAQSVAFTGFNGVEAVSTLADQKIAAPSFTMSAGGRYDFSIGPRLRGYVRGDWRFTGRYRAAPFGATTWNPDSNDYPSTSVTNVRAGIEAGGLDVNFFVNNLFEPHRGQVSGGRTGCALPANGGTPACANYSAYEVFRYTSWGASREIGVQIVYRR